MGAGGGNDLATGGGTVGRGACDWACIGSGAGATGSTAAAEGSFSEPPRFVASHSSQRQAPNRVNVAASTPGPRITRRAMSALYTRFESP